MKKPPPIVVSKFGARVRRERIARGLSQVKLAKRVGIEQPAISEIERGETDWRKMNAASFIGLAEALGVPTSYLITGMSISSKHGGSHQKAIDLLAQLTPANLAAWLAAGEALRRSQDKQDFPDEDPDLRPASRRTN